MTRREPSERTLADERLQRLKALVRHYENQTEENWQRRREEILVIMRPLEARLALVDRDWNEREARLNRARLDVEAQVAYIEHLDQEEQLGSVLSEPPFKEDPRTRIRRLAAQLKTVQDELARLERDS